MKIERFKIMSHEFKHPIEIQRKVSGFDEDGLPVEDSWETYFKTRAKVLNTRGKERLQSKEVAVEIDKTFYIRGRKDKEVTEADRILYKGNIYEVSTPPNDVEDSGLYVEINAKLFK